MTSDLPADSNATIDRRDGELTITLPPPGVWRGSKGLFFVAIVSCGMMAMITAVVMLQDDADDLAVWMVMGPVFWAACIWLLLFAINMGRKRVIIDVVGRALLITERGVFGGKQYEVHADEIESIRIGPSGAEVNDVTINELQIDRKTGTRLHLLSQRKDDELKWIASVLREALGAGA